MPAAINSCTARAAGARTAGSRLASMRSASSRRPIRSWRRACRCRACAALAGSPWACKAARAASSAFSGQASSRETSAISASATTQRARDSASFGSKAAGGAAQRGFGAPEIAQLRHGDAAQGQGGRVAPQGDVIEGAQRVAGRQRARSQGDQKVHGHSATFAASSGDRTWANLPPRARRIEVRPADQAPAAERHRQRRMAPRRPVPMATSAPCCAAICATSDKPMPLPPPAVPAAR